MIRSIFESAADTTLDNGKTTTDGKTHAMNSDRYTIANHLAIAFCAIFSAVVVGCGQPSETTQDSSVASPAGAIETPDASGLENEESEMSTTGDLQPDDLAMQLADSEGSEAEAKVKEIPSSATPFTPAEEPALPTEPGAMRDLRAETDGIQMESQLERPSARLGKSSSTLPEPGSGGMGGGGLAGRGGGIRRSLDTKKAEPEPANAGNGKGRELKMPRQEMVVEDSLESVQSAERTQSAAARIASELAPGEELWVIVRPEASATTARTQRPPGGSLMARLDGESAEVPCPLKHTAVEGRIEGYIASVNVTQQFENPFDSKIEAVYTFPLPDTAAVNEFVMTIGERRIRGVIQERKKAEQIYEAAKSQGHVASLMTQQRANIFTQKVANIEPGHRIDIEIRYFSTLRYDDGAYEFVFPMVVGPRYNPNGSRDGIGAVPVKHSGTSSQKTEVTYLAPNERSGHDVSLKLNIEAGVEIEELASINHLIEEDRTGSSRASVTLSRNDSIPNRDFVLRLKVAGNQIKTGMLTHEDEHGKYFTMMMYPPAELEHVERSPMEMVFVLDCSGSMNGKPIGQAKNAIAHCLQNLTPRDSFQIIQFSNNASQLGPMPLPATHENVQTGLKYLHSLNGTGGTKMIEGIRAALDFPHDEGRFRLVSFMTDGYIGNENEILAALHQKLGASRIFSFGVGSSPNRLLMDRMAILGRGAVAYLSLNDDAAEIMDRFNQRISHPAMTDLQIDWGNSMEVADVYPQRLPDLIVGRPVIITGRFRGEPGVVTVNGRAGMKPTSFKVMLNDDEATKSNQSVATVWARLKIKDMMNDIRKSPQAYGEIRGSILQTALKYNLMSSFTAFVAVDSMSQTDGEAGKTVQVPVEVPDGVNYELTVGGSDE